MPVSRWAKQNEKKFVIFHDAISASERGEGKVNKPRFRALCPTFLEGCLITN